MSGANPILNNVTNVASQLVVNVSTAAELFSALENATGGETIVLAPGNYGDLNLKFSSHPFVNYNSEVTILSADADDPATFNSVNLNGVSNLTFDSVEFDFVAEVGAPAYLIEFQAKYSDHITIKNSTFDGDVAEGVSETADGFATGKGVVVSNSSDITFENNEIFDFLTGGSFSNIDGLIVQGNDVHSIRSDGFDFISVNDVLIEGNYIHDFEGSPTSGDHMDMIQFWTTGTTEPSTNIIIRDNFLDSGQGTETQSIFMRNELVDKGLAGSEMFYQNISIENNVILNAHSHGITVGETDGLIIRNNTILYNQDSADNGSVNIPTIRLKSTSLDVVVEGNIVPKLDLEASSELTVVGNLVVQRDSSENANFVGDLFVNGLADSSATLSDLAGRPGGLIEQMGVGSSLPETAFSQSQAEGFIDAETGAGVDRMEISFDVVGLIDELGGSMDVSNATVSWDFGDGTSGTELVTQHAYQASGAYDVTAVVTLANGQVITIPKTIEVETPVALFTDFSNGATDLSDKSNSVTVGENITFENGQDGNAIRLNGGFISYEKSTEYLNNKEYTVSFDFKKDVGDESASGRVINLGSSFVITVEEDGITASITTSQGVEYLKVSNIGIEDADWHQVALTFSGATGIANLYVDGVVVKSIGGLEGAIQNGSASQPFYIGHPWGTEFPGLIDNVQFVRGVLEVQDGKIALFDNQYQQSLIDIDVDGSEPQNTPPVVINDPVPDKSSPNDIAAVKIEGTMESEYLFGTANADIITGVGGKDFIYGGDGDDVLFSGNLDHGQLNGELGDDTLNGGSAADALFGGEGNDALHGKGGNDKLYGGIGDDALSGGLGRDRLFGDAGNDTLSGGEDSDTLYGGDGHDILVGGSGRDYIHGDAGNDILVGGLGKDVLTGGQGSDVFVFDAGSGRDRISDFDVAEDIISLQGSSFQSVSEVLDNAFSNHGDLIIHIDSDSSDFSWSNSNYIRLSGVDQNDLSDVNFMLTNTFDYSVF